MASVEERVINIVAEQLGVDKEKITRETSFVNDLGADSLDTVELVMALEEEFEDQPLVQARLHVALLRVYERLGQYDAAEAHARAAARPGLKDQLLPAGADALAAAVTAPVKAAKPTARRGNEVFSAVWEG